MDAINKERAYFIIGVAAALILSCILAFFLYSNHLKKENDLKTKNIEAQEENDGLRLALYANMEMMDDDMRQYRHDNRHHRACLHSNGDKCVLFKAASYENMIHFEIKNTYDSTRYKALSKGDFETTKKDSEYHGYGIESMRRVVKKYDGKLEYSVEPEWVITDIYLQQKDEI